MSVDSEANYRLVGGFIVLVSIIIIATLLWLTNLDESRNKNFYTVYFKKHSLSGLQKDSYVTMKGITVGSVLEYKISPNNVEEVKVTLRLEPGTPVTTKTKAIITRNLLTGIAAVELMGARNGDQILNQVAKNENYPVIPEGASTFDQIAGSIPELLNNFSALSARAGAVFSEKNVKTVENILKQVEVATSKASNSMSGLEKLLKEITALSIQLKSTSSDVSGLAKGTQADLTKSLKELSKALTQANKTFAALEIQTEAVATSLVNTSQVISQQVVTVGQSMGEAADSVAHTAESFDNPRALITGPSEKALGPGENLAR